MQHLRDKMIQSTRQAHNVVNLIQSVLLLSPFAATHFVANIFLLLNSMNLIND